VCVVAAKQLQAMHRPVQQRANDRLGRLLTCQGVKVVLHGDGGLFDAHITAPFSPRVRKLSQVAISLSTGRAKQGDGVVELIFLPFALITVPAAHTHWRAAMYEIQIYSITRALWRWEVRCGGALLCCGTAHSKGAAASKAEEVIHT
jgi:hypothetical protein